MTLANKALKFIKLNTIIQSLLMIMSVIASMFIIKNLGIEVYANYIILQSFIGTFNLIVGIGFSQTITKIWIEYEEKKYRDSLLIITFTFQIIIIATLLVCLLIYPNLLLFIFDNDFINLLTSIELAMVIFSTIFNVALSPILIAELDNKYTLTANSLNALLVACWLLYVSFFKYYNVDIIIFVVILINFLTSCIVLIGSIKYIKKIIFFNILDIKSIFIIIYMKHLLSASLVKFFSYFSSLSFIAIVLTKFNMRTELVYVSIFMKIIGLINTLVGMPTSKVTEVLFVKAFKNRDQKMMNIIYRSITKYYVLVYIAIFSLLYHSNVYILEYFYNIKVSQEFNLFFIISIFGSILGVANWIMQINQHYKVTYLFAMLSIFALNVCFWLLSPICNMYGILIGLFVSYLVYSGSSFVYVQLKYKDIMFPSMFMMKTILSSVSGILFGYLFDNILASSIVCMSMLFFIFYFTLKLDKNDKIILSKLEDTNIIKKFMIWRLA